MPIYHCLIPDFSGDGVLVIPSGDHGWALPAFEHEDEWFALASTAVARSASASYAVSMTALRERSVTSYRVCELETQIENWLPPAGSRWVRLRDLETITLEPAVLPEVLREWFLEGRAGAIPAVRPPWERRGWYAQAARWIESECTRMGYRACGPVEQVKAAWSLSTILRVSTSAGMIYFKADTAKPPSEPAIIEALARRWPRNVPAIVAADHDRGWMLMRDFGARTLERQPLGLWEEANRVFSAIQVGCSMDLEPWWQLQCPDFRIPALVAHMDRMVADSAALRVGEPGGLTSRAADRLKELLPRLHDMWDELAAIPIPASVVQQDFRHHNLVMSGEAYLFYDWSDTVVSHPFFACNRFLDYIKYDQHPRRRVPLDERQRKVARAYLRPWAAFLDEADLRRAFNLTRRLNPVYVAIRRYLDAPHCEPASAWGRAMREGPATELNRFLEDADKTESVWSLL